MFGLFLLKASNLFSLPVCSMSVENLYGVWLSMDLSGIELWNFSDYKLSIITLNFLEKIDLDFSCQGLSNDMSYVRDLKISSMNLPCPYFFHGNGIFPILSNINLMQKWCGRYDAYRQK